MSEILDELKTALGNLEKNIKADLDEIRRSKQDVQELRQDIFDAISGVRVIDGGQRLILSAPEIIIGNVDDYGDLKSEGGGSKVIIRANEVSLEGHGTNNSIGLIRARAPQIQNIAVDPGIDGLEDVVYPVSEILNQARNVTLQSNDDDECFSTSAIGHSGITIMSDTMVNIDARPSNKVLTNSIDARMKTMEEDLRTQKKESDEVKKSIESVMKELDKLADEHSKLYLDDEGLCSNHPDMATISAKYLDLERILCNNVTRYVRLLSMQAETNRKTKALKKKKSELSSKASSFAKNPTSSFVSISSETVIMSSIDGDGNIRENKEAGLYVQAPHIQMMAHDKDGKLIKDSTIDVNHQTITVSTGNPALDEKREKGDIPAVGDVKITSKNITLESLDYELKDKKIQEKALTKTGAINIRAEKIDAQATDTEGKSTGSITMNAKQITAASMDVDKEKRQPKQLAAGSQMVLVSEKMFAGSKDKKTKSKLVQLSSEKVGIMATSTAEMQQGDGKAVATLDGGNVTLGGSKVEIAGDMKFGGKADFSGDLSAPKGTFKNLEASTSFKSSNISDGIPVPAPSAPSKPSAKMKEEEAKQQ